MSMFSWFRPKPKKIVHLSHEDILFIGGLVMALVQEFKDAVAAVDGAADKVVAAIADLKAAGKNSLTDQEVADIKAGLAGVKTKLDNAIA